METTQETQTRQIPKELEAEIKKDLIYTNSGLSRDTLDKLTQDDLITLWEGLSILVSIIAKENTFRAKLTRAVNTMSEATAEGVYSQLLTLTD